MRSVFGQPVTYDEWLSPKCKQCFNCVKTGCGTKFINGQRQHFDIYGCADIDRTVKCLEMQKESK